MLHYSVLLKESIDNLNIKDGDTIVDCTLGYGGHSSEILKLIPNGHLYAFDQDVDAINYSRKRLSKISDNFTIINSNFVNIKSKLYEEGINKVDGILYDLGVSSPQLDEGDRGFSFHQDARLDMRMDKNNSLSAYEVVNNYSYNELVSIFKRYGEEKYANSIARGIEKIRKEKPIETTLELVEVIKNNVPEKYKREKHPARKVFQAIRIEVNDELNVCEKSLRDSLDLLTVGGRLCVITFHSLEDKLVKKLFKEVSIVPNDLMKLPVIPEKYQPKFKLIKMINPSDEEVNENNRSRSAHLRIIERIKD